MEAQNEVGSEANGQSRKSHRWVLAAMMFWQVAMYEKQEVSEVNE